MTNTTKATKTYTYRVDASARSGWSQTVTVEAPNKAAARAAVRPGMVRAAQTAVSAMAFTSFSITRLA